MLRSWVEKPPRPTAEKAWQTASNQPMPHSFSATMPAAVISTYTNHSELAVSVMRGASRSSFTEPGAAPLYSCMPPTPSSGSTASAMTMMPRPPNHSSAWRQKFSDGGSWSRPVSTVEPVVVRPDMASKKAPVKVSPGMRSSSGSAAAAGSSTQPRVTSRKPSRGCSSRCGRWVSTSSSDAAAPGGGRGEQEDPPRPSPMSSEQASGTRQVAAKLASSRPRTCATASTARAGARA